MYTFNPTAGIPKTSYNEKSLPDACNITWFSTTQPKDKTMTGFTNLNDTPKLTDEQAAEQALLAAKTFFVTDDEGDETEAKDIVTAPTLH